MKRMLHNTVIGFSGYRISQEMINDETFITSYHDGVILVKNNVELLLTKEELNLIFNDFNKKGFNTK